MGIKIQNIYLRLTQIDKTAVAKTVTWLPERIEALVSTLDAKFGGTDTVSRFHRRSLLAFFLPIPVYMFIIWGPSLAKDDAGGLAWRGGLTAVLLLIGAIGLQTFYFMRDRWRGKMAWLHLVLIVLLVLITWIIAGKDATQASASFYRHYYGPLALIAMFVAVPLAWWLKRRQLFALPAKAISDFQNSFNAGLIVAQGNPRSLNMWDVFGALMIVVLRTPLHVIAPVALIILAAPHDQLKTWALVSSFLSLMLFAVSNYDPERDAFVRFVRNVFLSGGSFLVTLAIVVLAGLRLAGVDYVTTVLDAGTRFTIFSYIFSTYALFWLYDFWVNQAILDLLGKLDNFKNVSSTLRRHGGGRIAVTASGCGGREKRMFEPAVFLMRIAQNADPSKSQSLQEEASRAEQRFRTLAYACLLVFAGAICLVGSYMHHLDQSPGLSAAVVTAKGDTTHFFDLPARLINSGGEPVVMLAASGGGTRAALYTTSVLHGLARLGKLDHLVLASGVSGGSAALAYFANHTPSLLQNDDAAWFRMRETLSAPFIEDVLAGAAEWRIVSGVRLGQLLTESFKRKFLKEDVAGELGERTKLGTIQNVGLIFNTSLCGSPALGDASIGKESATSAGGILAITNLRSCFDTKLNLSVNNAEYELPMEVVNDPSVSIFESASLSANFPPVFSNAAVKLGDKRFWVTDGGAVENRGLVSILFALAEALKTIREQTKHSTKKIELADIRLIVADASAFQPDYKSDRGMGAKFGAPEKLANGLVKELLTEINGLHKSICGRENGIMVVYLPMPGAMRAAGTFGTHWMMPPTVTFKDPLSGNGGNQGIELKRDVVIEIIDAIFSKEYSASYIQKRWPELDAHRIMEETKRPWTDLEAAFK